MAWVRFAYSIDQHIFLIQQDNSNTRKRYLTDFSLRKRHMCKTIAGKAQYQFDVVPGTRFSRIHVYQLGKLQIRKGLQVETQKHDYLSPCRNISSSETVNRAITK